LADQVPEAAAGLLAKTDHEIRVNQMPFWELQTDPVKPCSMGTGYSNDRYLVELPRSVKSGKIWIKPRLCLKEITHLVLSRKVNCIETLLK
jgi:hypothetical protein